MFRIPRLVKEKNSMTKPEGHKMVEIAIDLMTELAFHSKELGPREISRKFEISTTAAQRLVTSLHRKDCLEFDEVTKKYKLGMGVLRLSKGLNGKSDIIQVSKKHIETLCQNINETICLNTVVENRRMTIYQVESHHELRFTAEIGKLFPIFIGASGKAILANLPEDRQESIITNQIDVENRDALKLELESIREKGYAVTYGERIAGGVGIAVPISTQGTLYSLSVYAPNHRIDEQKIPLLIEELKRTIQAIEKEL